MAKRRLSERQRQRIRAIQEQRRQRLEMRLENERLEQEGKPNPPTAGTVITRHGQNLVVEDGGGQLWHCLSRQNIGDPVCGDRVVWQATGDRQGVVTAIQPRRSALRRPNYSGENRALAANITQMVVVLAPEPPPSRYLLDQYLVAAEKIGVRALIVLNKKDLWDAQAQEVFRRDFRVYAGIGYPLVRVSAHRRQGLDAIERHLRGETSILVGQSGVGKSSLVNALLPDLELQVGRLSQTSGMGRHTTSATTLYHLTAGGALIDSPGVRSFRLGWIDQRQLEQGFREFRPFLGRCRFSNCSHTHEPGCALRAAVHEGRIDGERMANFQHMLATTPARK